MSKKYPKEKLSEIVKSSFTYTEVAKKLGIKSSDYIKILIEKYNIDICHFKRSYIFLNPKKRKPSKDILVYRKSKTREDIKALRRALLESGIKEKCVLCGLESFWNNSFLRLQIDHIDGVAYNNQIENLRFLCPNCHSQTATYCSKNIKNKNKKPKIRKEKISKRPPKEILEKEVWEMSCSQLAKKYGVSDNGVGKWCKYYKIKKPGRGYWTKLQFNTMDELTPPKEVLEKEIWMYTFMEIGKKYNVSPRTVSKWCDKYNIKKPHIGYWNNKTLK